MSIITKLPSLFNPFKSQVDKVKDVYANKPTLDDWRAARTEYAEKTTTRPGEIIKNIKGRVKNVLKGKLQDVADIAYTAASPLMPLIEHKHDWNVFKNIWSTVKTVKDKVKNVLWTRRIQDLRDVGSVATSLAIDTPTSLYGTVTSSITHPIIRGSGSAVVATSTFVGESIDRPVQATKKLSSIFHEKIFKAAPEAAANDDGMPQAAAA